MNKRMIYLLSTCFLLIGLLQPAASPPTSADTSSADLYAYPVMEATQGVQTYKASGNVQMVAGKRTFVFFYARTLTGGDYYPTARLTAERNGVIVNLLPLNNNGTAKMSPLYPDRYHGLRQFRFELPSAYTYGTVSLTAVVNPGHDKPVETDYSNNTSQKTLTFQTVPELSLAMYDVMYRIYGHGDYVYSLNDIEQPGVRSQRGQMIDWLRAAYPLNKINWVTRSIYMGKKIKYNSGNINMLCTTVNAAIVYNAVTQPAGPNPHGYGMVSASGAYMRGCAELISDRVASGPTRLINGNFNSSTGAAYGGHELGHIFGRGHPKPKACDEGLIDSDPYPYQYGLITPNSQGFVDSAHQWGPAVVGFNHATDMKSPQFYINDTYDIMTYCPKRWLSDFSYKIMMDYFQDEFSAARAPVALAPSAPMDRFVIMGAIDAVTGNVMIEPVYVTPNLDTAATHQDGDHTIVLRSAAGAVLLRYPFTPSEPGEIEPATAREVRDGLEPEHPAGRMSQPRYVFEFVPSVAGTARIDIEGPGGALLHTIQAGPSAPVVRVTAPNGGTRVDPTQQELPVSWAGSDPDGDPLTYRVEYSSDNGLSWFTYAQAITETTIALPQDVLQAGTSALVRISATDGVNSTRDTSDTTFAVLNHAPQLEVTAPSSGAESATGPPIYARGQTITVLADAYDIDDGDLNDSVVWSSNLDGQLGTGEVLGTASLSVGTHTLTATVVDSAGSMTTAQTQVRVVATLDDLPPTPNQLVAMPNSVQLSTVMTGTEVYIGNFNPYTTMTWNATANQPWVQLSAPSGLTDSILTISYDRSMLPDGLYEATVTLTSPEAPGVTLTIPVGADILYRNTYLPLVRK